VIETLERSLAQSQQRCATLEQQSSASSSRELATHEEFEQLRSRSNQLEQQLLLSQQRIETLEHASLHATQAHEQQIERERRRADEAIADAARARQELEQAERQVRTLTQTSATLTLASQSATRDADESRRTLEIERQQLREALASAAALQQAVARSQQESQEDRQRAQRMSARIVDLEQQLVSSQQRSVGERTKRLELEQRVAALTLQLEGMEGSLHEQKFMSAMCKDATSFEFVDSDGEVVGDANANGAKLGQGAFGVALRSRCIVQGHPRPTQQYALKVCFNYDELSTNTVRGVFVTEFMELVKLPSHPNIVRFVCQFVAEVQQVSRFLPDFAPLFSDDGRPLKTQFFALELLTTSLSGLLMERRGRGVSQREASLIIAQVGCGLRHLENHRIAHRDIKPPNVLVELTNDERREVKRCVIGDFGSACELNENLCSTVAVSDTGSLLTPKWGNDAHTAPELHSRLQPALSQRRAAMIEMDYSKQGVFELGVLAFEVLIGSVPFAGYPGTCTNRQGVVEYADTQIPSIIEQHANQQQQRQSSDTTTITREQEAILKRAVSCDPSRRPTLQEVIDCFDPDQSLRLA